MNILVRAAAAVALLAFATPALPCGDKAQNTTASSSSSDKKATEKKATPAKGAAKPDPAATGKVVAKKTAEPRQASAPN